MIKLISKITLLINKSTTNGNSPSLSNTFNLPISPENLDFSDFLAVYNYGYDVALTFNWVNEIEIDSSFKNLTKTAKITFPRNLKFNGLLLRNGLAQLFARGDRIIIQTGYEQSGLKEIFRGYVTKIGINTPLVIECEDQMFGLKQMKFKYPVQGIDTAGKITLKDLLNRMFSQNTLLADNQFIFDLNPTTINTETIKNENGLIPVICPQNTAPFTYSTGTEKSIAEVLNDLKKKLFLYSYFDDFGNFHIELPFINSQLLPHKKTFIFEKQIIDTNNLKLQREEELNVKIIFESKRSDKKKGSLYGNKLYDVNGIGNGFVGDALGDSITVHGPEDLSQDDCDKYAKQILAANKYTGYAKGSTFETFGEPAIYIGEGINLISTLFPEKGGNADIVYNGEIMKGGSYAVVGVRRTFGMNGYRQHIEIGININTLTGGGSFQ